MKIIWKQKPSVGELNQRNEGTLSSYLKMRCTEVGDDYLKAELLLEKHHHQPDGIMNGGSLVFLPKRLLPQLPNIV